jgi:hypothetical protein
MIEITDKYGNVHIYQNRNGRKLNFVCIGTYPAHAPTAFSSGNEEKRDIVACTLTFRENVKIIRHHIKQFQVFDLEMFYYDQIWIESPNFDHILSTLEK